MGNHAEPWLCRLVRHAWLACHESEQATAAMAPNTTQVTNLLTDYNAVNNFFSSNTTNVVVGAAPRRASTLKPIQHSAMRLNRACELGMARAGRMRGYKRTGCSAQPVATSKLLRDRQAMRTSSRQAGCALRRGCQAHAAKTRSATYPIRRPPVRQLTAGIALHRAG